MGQLEKTEKSMIELELDLNQKIGEWGILCESASNLKPIAGPGLTGMRNLGNSCYLNSVMQVMFTIPDFVKRFVEGGKEFFDAFSADPANDFNIQMAKLGTGLCSGKYSVLTENSMDTVDSTSGIAPTMFKSLIGKGHPDFSTKQQQDSQEFFLHLVSTLQKHSHNQTNPADALKFSIEDRVECTSSGKVMYNRRDDWCLPLQIPLNLATNIAEVKKYEEDLALAEKEGRRLDPEALVHPKIPLSACLDTFAQPETVEQFYSTAINAKTTAKKTTKLATMPDFLMLHLKKFTLKESKSSKKSSTWKPSAAPANNPTSKNSPNSSAKPLPLPPWTPPSSNNSRPWASPRKPASAPSSSPKTPAPKPPPSGSWNTSPTRTLPPPSSPRGPTPSPPPAPHQPSPPIRWASRCSWKWDSPIRRQRRPSRRRRISHPDELDCIAIGEAAAGETTEQVAPSGSTAAAAQYRDGTGKYKLVGFISHMVTSSQVGHYVCHILKDGVGWVIFNDNNVAISQNPPKELGYLYLYQRI